MAFLTDAFRPDIVHHILDLFVRDECPLDTDSTERSRLLEEHIALAEQRFCPSLIENDAGIEPRLDHEGDTARNVGFDDAGDDIG